MPDTGTLVIYTTLLDAILQALPQTFCRLFLRFSSPSGVFLSSGLVAQGLPLAVFLPPPVFSPWFLGGVGCVFFLLASCILHLLCRNRLGKLGDTRLQTPRPLPLLSLGSCLRHPSPVGSRRGDEPSTRAVGRPGGL